MVKLGKNTSKFFTDGVLTKNENDITLKYFMDRNGQKLGEDGQLYSDKHAEILYKTDGTYQEKNK